MLLAEMSVSRQNPWVNCKVKDLRLPSECVIVSVLHDGKINFPCGDTPISENDKVLFITSHPVLEKIVKDLSGRRMKYAE